MAQRLARLYPDWKVVGSSPTRGTFLNCDKTVIIKDIRNHNTRHYSTWNMSKYSLPDAHYHDILSHIDSKKNSTSVTLNAALSLRITRPCSPYAATDGRCT